MSSPLGTEVARAGWLYRQSTFLHRWKKNWFVLDKQGDLRYFESPNHPTAEERIVVRAHVNKIKFGPDCAHHDPPDEVNRFNCSFMELDLRDRSNMVLCADSVDDMKAWQIALEQARAFVPAGAPPVGPLGAPYMAPAPGFVQYSTPYAPYGTYAPLGVGPLLGTSYGYPGQVISTTPTQQVMNTPTGTTTVIAVPQYVMDDDPWRYRGRYDCGRRRYHHHW